MDLKDQLAQGLASALGEPRNSRIDSYVSKGHGPLPGNAKLLAWDANSIHGFVFDTSNATGIRGASDLLKSLGTDLRKGRQLGIDPEQILYAGGGSGMAFVNDKACQTVISKLHQLFAERTLVATCTAAAVDLVKDDETFGQRVLAVEQAMDDERARIDPNAEPAVPFFAERCQVCGRRAAAGIKKRHGNRDRLECDACSHRIRQGGRNRYYQNEPSDYKAIADDNGRGFLAVIYADGNGIGERIARLTSPYDYAQFSRAIMDVMSDCFRDVARKYRLAEDDAAGFQGAYQLPICAGDDLVAIVPGEVAVPFTRDLLASLESRFDDQPGCSKIGLAAGVAIGKATFPVRHLFAEAEELLKNLAKKRVYRDGARSAMTFAVVADGSPRAESVQPERWQQDENQFLLSGLPYTLEEIQRFSQRFRKIRAARGIGRSQLYTVRGYAQRGQQQLRNHILYQVGRRKGWQQLICELADDPAAHLSGQTCMEQILPCYGERRVFDLADMIVLYRHWKEAGEVESP